MSERAVVLGVAALCVSMLAVGWIGGLTFVAKEHDRRLEALEEQKWPTKPF